MSLTWVRTAIGVALIALTPLPSFRALIGADLPAGLNPVNLLVLVGLAFVLASRPRLPVREAALVAALATAHFALLVVAWARTSPDSVALVGNWLVVPLAGVLAVLLFPAERRAWWLGAAFGASLVVLGGSILAEVADLYDPPVPELTGPLAVKPNGGFMLQANEAGALYATFAVPAALLLRDWSRVAAGLFLGFSLVIVFVTGSRESIVVLGLALLAAAIATGRVRNTARAALAAVAAAALWAIASPSAFARIYDDPNYFLRGRPTIWREALEFSSRDLNWLVGGGLESFEAYVQTTELRYAFTTHNEVLRLLVDGGLLLVAVYLALVVAIGLLAVRARGQVALALAIALGSFVLIGLVKDFGFFTRSASWLWALAALALLVSRDRRREVT